METLWQDVKYGARMLVKNRGVTLVAVLTLALGIGANTAIFSLLNSLLLRPLPVENPEELVAVFGATERGRWDTFSYPEYADFRDGNQAFTGLAAYAGISVSMNREQQTELVDGEIVTGNYFDLLGVKPLVGRTFAADEDRTPETHPVVVLGESLWREQFGGDRSVLGQMITLNGRPFTVIGIVPAEFQSARRVRASGLWVPMMMQSLVRPPSSGLRRQLGGSNLLNARNARWLNMVGRLKPGVSPEQARAGLEVVVRQLEQAYPRAYAGMSIQLFRAGEEPGLRAQVIPILTVLMTVVGLVLLIACANVANLLLARASARRREIAVRLTLGAGRLRLARQLVTENLLLAVLGAVAGLLLGMWSAELLYAFGLPAGLSFDLDMRMLLYTLGLALTTGLVFGLAPALQAARTDLVGSLKDEAAAASARGRSKLRSALVVAQVALSLVLLVGAGLFLRTLHNAQQADVGFRPQGLLLATMNLDVLQYSEARGYQFQQQLLQRAAELPGVESTTWARVVPLTGSSRRVTIRPEGTPEPPEGPAINSYANTVGTGYFRTLGIPLLRGRDFTEQDRPGAPSVAVITEALAQRFWPNEEAVGKRIVGTREPLEVVGVVRNSKYASVREEPQPILYVPLAQNYEAIPTLHVRIGGGVATSAASLRAIVRELDANLPLVSIRTAEEALGLGLAPERLMGTLLGVFGGLAVVLAAVGLYGVVAYSVAQRTREIGIRVALGAQRRSVFRMVMQHGLSLTTLGGVIGLAAAAGAASVPAVGAMLFGIRPRDPLTFATVAALLVLVAAAACYIPARRATRVDPIVALRYE